jgi:hypothetical protein
MWWWWLLLDVLWALEVRSEVDMRAEWDMERSLSVVQGPEINPESPAAEEAKSWNLSWHSDDDAIAEGDVSLESDILEEIDCKAAASILEFL